MSILFNSFNMIDGFWCNFHSEPAMGDYGEENPPKQKDSIETKTWIWKDGSEADKHKNTGTDVSDKMEMLLTIEIMNQLVTGGTFYRFIVCGSFFFKAKKVK